MRQHKGHDEVMAAVTFCIYVNDEIAQTLPLLAPLRGKSVAIAAHEVAPPTDPLDVQDEQMRPLRPGGTLVPSLFGLFRDQIRISNDFDAPLDGFEELG